MLQPRKTSLRFNREPVQPCTYLASSSIYIACLGCVTAHETRFCDGTTSPSWQLCPKHQELSEKNGLLYDEEMLHFLRKMVHNGSIPKPKFNVEQPAAALIPPTPVTPRTPSKDAQDDNTDEPLDPELEVAKASSHTSTTHVPHTTRRTLRKQAHHVLWPIPTASYGHSAICIYSPWIQFTTKSTQTTSNTKTLPPSIKIITEPVSLAAQDARHTAKMAHLRQESLQSWEAGNFVGTTDSQIHAMNEELRCSRLAKAVFFRRCNGMYVNALGWVWTDEDKDKDGLKDGERIEGKTKANGFIGCNGQDRKEDRNDPCRDIHEVTDNIKDVGEQSVNAIHASKDKRLKSRRTTFRMKNVCNKPQHQETQEQDLSLETPIILDPQDPPIIKPSDSESLNKPPNNAPSPAPPVPLQPSTTTTTNPDSISITISRLQARESLTHNNPATSQNSLILPGRLIRAQLEQDLAITFWAWQQRYRATQTSSKRAGESSDALQ